VLQTIAKSLKSVNSIVFVNGLQVWLKILDGVNVKG